VKREKRKEKKRRRGENVQLIMYNEEWNKKEWVTGRRGDVSEKRKVKGEKEKMRAGDKEERGRVLLLVI